MSNTKFVHYHAGTNLGDILCSPRHYFSFAHNHPELVVIGGGTLLEHLTGKKQSPEHAIVWGVGSGGASAAITNAPVLDWGARDLDIAGDDEHFLPCVSALHPMLDLPIGDAYDLIYLNADPNLISANALRNLKTYAEKNGFKLLTNRATEREFIAAWSQSRHVVTNSYHGAYWSLLTGRRVSLYGHNSKFAKLFDTFGIEGTVLRFDRGNEMSFALTTGRAMNLSAAVGLPDAKATLAAFRDRQLAFAARLVEKGVVTACNPLSFKPGDAVTQSITDSETQRIDRTYKESVFG